MRHKATTCEQRDGYIGRWLTAAERAEFEAHLAACPDCRQVVQEEERLDSLLARANSALHAVPPGLVDRIRRRQRRRRVLAWTTGLAAAGILLGFFAAWFFVPRAPEHGSPSSAVLAKRAGPVEPAPDPRSLVQVIFEHPADVIAVPHKTDNPSITIIWVYPTIKAAQELKPGPPELFQRPERNGI